MSRGISRKALGSGISVESGALGEGLGGDGDVWYITGLPVAEDTFGVEMFVQMGVSAPLAGLMIFLLLWYFFRSPRLIIAPPRRGLSLSGHLTGRHLPPTLRCTNRTFRSSATPGHLLPAPPPPPHVRDASSR